MTLSSASWSSRPRWSDIVLNLCVVNTSWAGRMAVLLGLMWIHKPDREAGDGGDQ